MTEQPRTAAGRALLATRFAPTSGGTLLLDAILAIEAEAQARPTVASESDYQRGWRDGQAMLAARPAVASEGLRLGLNAAGITSSGWKPSGSPGGEQVPGGNPAATPVASEGLRAALPIAEFWRGVGEWAIANGYWTRDVGPDGKALDRLLVLVGMAPEVRRAVDALIAEVEHDTLRAALASEPLIGEVVK